MVLNGDLKVCTDTFLAGIAEHNLNQFWRRTIVRTIFALVEGISHQYKKVALQISEITQVEFSDAEITLLKELSYSLNARGEADTSKAKLRTVDNMLFSIKMFAKSCSQNFDIDKSGNDWQCFKNALKIRDRITHPKNIADLEITDDEMPTILNAGAWFTLIINVSVVKMFAEFFEKHKTVS